MEALRRREKGEKEREGARIGRRERGSEQR